MVAVQEMGGCYPFHNPISLRFERDKDSEAVSQMRGLVLFCQVFLSVPRNHVK